MTAYTVERARRDLRFLQEVRAVRQVDELPDDAGFVVELPDGRVLELPLPSVAALHAGVLTGWRLPRQGLPS